MALGPVVSASIKFDGPNKPATYTFCNEDLHKFFKETEAARNEFKKGSFNEKTLSDLKNIRGISLAEQCWIEYGRVVAPIFFLFSALTVLPAAGLLFEHLVTRFASPSFQTLVDDYAAKGIAFEQAKRLHGSKHMTSVRAEYESLCACCKIFERVWQHTIRTNVAESENAGIRQSEFLGGACELIDRAIERQNADVSVRQALVKNFEDDFKLSRRLCLVGDLFWYSPPLPRLEVN